MSNVVPPKPEATAYANNCTHCGDFISAHAQPVEMSVCLACKIADRIVNRLIEAHRRGEFAR